MGSKRSDGVRRIGRSGMSIFQCEECGCAENTSLGWFHCRNLIKDPKYHGKKLCSACGPTQYDDGTPIEKTGKWHGRFERRFYEKDSMETNNDGNLVPKRRGEQG